jgi:hypothetical protein
MSTLSNNQETNSVQPLELDVVCPSLTTIENELSDLSEREILTYLLVVFKALAHEVHGDAWVLAFYNAKGILKEMGIEEDKAKKIIATILMAGRGESKKNPVSGLF